MSGKLDQSLDEIVSTHRRGGSNRGRRVRTTRQGGAKPAAAPVGGVKKTTRPVKGATKGVPTGPSGGVGESKILVSGLVSSQKDINGALTNSHSPEMSTSSRSRYVVDEAL